MKILGIQVPFTENKDESTLPPATASQEPVGMDNGEPKQPGAGRRRKTRRGKKRGTKRSRTGKRSNRS